MNNNKKFSAPWEVGIYLGIVSRNQMYQSNLTYACNPEMKKIFLPNIKCANRGNYRVIDMFTFL